MPNTIAVELVPDRVSNAVITTIGVKLAALQIFSRNFGTNPLAPKATVQVPRISSTDAAQTNPTNFEQGDSVGQAVTVAVDQISKSVHVTNEERQQGFTLEQLAGKAAQAFGNAISDVWTTLLKASSYGAGRIIGPAANFDSGTLAEVHADSKNYSSRSLVLDGSYTGRLLNMNAETFKATPASGAFGFDRSAEQNRWTGSDSNVVGLVCSPDAIAVASGLPFPVPGDEYFINKTITIPGIQLSVLLLAWIDRSTRSEWMSLDAMFGAAPGDTGQLKLLTSS
jgi:hypothetical protein